MGIVFSVRTIPAQIYQNTVPSGAVFSSRGNTMSRLLTEHPCWTEDVERAKMLALKADLQFRSSGRPGLGSGPLEMAEVLCMVFPQGGSEVNPKGEETFEEILQATLLLLVPAKLDYSHSDLSGAFSEQVADMVFAMRPDDTMNTKANQTWVSDRHFVLSSPAVQTIKTLAIFVSCISIIPTFGADFARRWVKRMNPLLRAMEDASAQVHMVTHAQLLQLESALDELEG